MKLSTIGKVFGRLGVFTGRDVVHTPTKKLEFEKDDRCLLYYYKPNVGFDLSFSP